MPRRTKGAVLATTMPPGARRSEPEPEPEPEPSAVTSLPALPPAPAGAQSSALEVLRLRAQLAAAEQVIAGHRTELLAEAERRKQLEAQLNDVASGRAVSMEQHQQEVWARHAAQREAAQLRNEMELLRSQEKERHDNAVASLLWLESEAKRGRSSVLELQVRVLALDLSRTRGACSARATSLRQPVAVSQRSVRASHCHASAAAGDRSSKPSTAQRRRE
jgi:hypothetical protein